MLIKFLQIICREKGLLEINDEPELMRYNLGDNLLFIIFQNFRSQPLFNF
jgi:hypothetical protein